MTAETIPAFVFRGLNTLNSSQRTVTWRNEADLRDALATRMWFSGVDEISTEVQVPNCGRIDILADEGGRRCIIELKQSITTVSAARKAYRQADMYRAYTAATMPYLGQCLSTLVLGLEWDDDAVRPAALAYPDVRGDSYFRATDYVRITGFPEVNQGVELHPDRRSRITERRAFVERLLAGLDRADRQWAELFERRTLDDVAQVA